MKMKFVLHSKMNGGSYWNGRDWTWELANAKTWTTYTGAMRASHVVQRRCVANVIVHEVRMPVDNQGELVR